MVIGRYMPRLGGTEIQAQRLARALADGGLSVEILTGRERGLAAREKRFGVAIQRLWIPDAGVPLLNALVLSVGIYSAIGRRRSESDVIHVHQALYPAFAAVTAAMRYNKPSVVKISGSGDRLDLNQLAGQAGGLGEFAARFLCKHTDAFVALNSSVAQSLNGDWHVPEYRICRIPNGVEVPRDPNDKATRGSYRRRLDLPPVGPLIMCVGSLRAVKNHKLAIRATERLVRLGSGARLVLVGDGPLRPELERLVSDNHLNQHVEFVGRVKNVRDYLYAADAFVLPSSSEGLSNALLEAMAVGLPCVVSNVPGNREVVKHGANGVLFDSGNVDALADALSGLLSDAEHAASLGHQARETIAGEYSLDIVAKQYLALYCGLLDSS
jgi:glycosyltransferase involved in cell wall biosynthesis